jgi:type I restriction enzyme M protein
LTKIRLAVIIKKDEPSYFSRLEAAVRESQYAGGDDQSVIAGLLGVSRAFVAERARREPSDGLGTTIYSLSSARGNVFAVVALADAGGFGPAEAFARAVLEQTGTAGVGIVHDARAGESRFVKRRFDRAEFEYAPPYVLFSEGADAGSLGWSYANGGFWNARPLEPLTARVENLFFEVHSHFRDIDGLHADEALDELCKVLYAKLYDEESTPSEQAYRLQRRPYGCADECAADARALYAEASAYDRRVFAMKIPGYARSRGVFATPIRLSNAALVKAVEAFQGYHLGASGVDVKGRAFQKVIGPTVRAGMGQYFTPDPVVRFLVRALRPGVRDLILDPFCGSGHFLSASLALARREHGADDRAFHEFAFGKLHGIEKSDRMARVAMTDMRLHGDGHGNIRCVDALLSFDNYPDMKPESFDVVLTNPPFGSLLGRDALQGLGEFDLARDRRNVPLEVLGLERSVQLLRPGGRLGIVLPDGIVANRNTAYAREWLAEKAKIRAVISLPLETFVPFGASVKTSVVIARKWEPGETAKTDYPVFLARADGVGYDATGRPRAGDELEAVGEEFARFIAEWGW